MSNNKFCPECGEHTDTTFNCPNHPKPNDSIASSCSAVVKAERAAGAVRELIGGAMLDIADIKEKIKNLKRLEREINNLIANLKQNSQEQPSRSD